MARFEKVLCDRCKTEIDMTIPHKRDIWLSGKGREGGFDLCDECYEGLYEWFMQKSIDICSDCKYNLGDGEVNIICIGCENGTHKETIDDNYFPNICKTCRHNVEQRVSLTGAPIASEICKKCNRGTHYSKSIAYENNCP